MNKQLDKIKLSKRITHSSLNEKVDDTEYWRLKSPEERFEAIELLRQIFYNYDPATARLQRVIESAELRKS